MAGTTRMISFITVVGVTTTVDFINESPGGYSRCTFLWGRTTLSGTWDIAIYATVGGTDVKIAELLGQVAGTISRVPLTADFNFEKAAIPAPTKAIMTEVVAGTVSNSRIWAIYGGG